MGACQQDLGRGTPRFAGAALSGGLAALAVELLGASLGWSLEARFGICLGVVGLVGRLAGRAGVCGLAPGRLRLGPPGGLALAALVAALWPIAVLGLAGDFLPWAGWVRERAPLVPSGYWLWGAILVGPITEEALYRGLLQRNLRAAMGPGAAGLITALAFTAAHALACGAAGPQHLLAGLGLAAVAERSGGWWAPALLHAAGNAGWLLAGSL